MDQKTKDTIIQLIELVWSVIDDDDNDIVASAEAWWEFKREIEEIEVDA